MLPRFCFVFAILKHAWGRSLLLKCFLEVFSAGVREFGPKCAKTQCHKKPCSAIKTMRSDVKKRSVFVLSCKLLGTALCAAMAAPLRLKTNGASCNSLLAGQSFLQKQVKTEKKENIEEDLRVTHLKSLDRLTFATCLCKTISLNDRILSQVAASMLQMLKDKAALLQSPAPEQPNQTVQEEAPQAMPVALCEEGALGDTQVVPTPPRPVATPARVFKPVSSDAQPRSPLESEHDESDDDDDVRVFELETATCLTIM